MESETLSKLYKKAHNIMRDVDGLQPQEAFDELLKYLFFHQNFETLNNGLINNNLNAKIIRKKFREFLGKTNSWSSEIWRDKNIYLSDEALEKIYSIFKDIQFNQINFDIRGEALKEFLTPEIRKGLGIFLTPNSVVSSIVAYLSHTKYDKVLDPACGSGTFLIEYLKQHNNFDIYGFDKNPRMLLLSDLNLGHLQNINFNKRLIDTLKDANEQDKYDLIITNPPFGVSIDARHYNFNNFLTCQDKDGYHLKKQTSEIIFIEKCLQLLKPGGTLSIVIPKSIATNNTLQISREMLSKYGYIYTIFSLPPETFATTGTQTTTIVLFIKKYKNKNEQNESIKIPIATITNIGYDSTGRYKSGNQLLELDKLIKKSLKNNKDNDIVKLVDFKYKKDTFKKLSNIFINKKMKKNDFLLYELCEYIGTGRTPARKDYTENGNFLIKVGNLTGTGINWVARDRNFISNNEIEKRIKSKKPLILQQGDILLTSSAHNPIYIARKSDIFTGLPNFLNSKYVSFVGEIMLIRVDKNKIDPYILLAFLKDPLVISNIQKMVRGQTAHLHASDLKNLIVPNDIFKNKKYLEISKLLKKQSILSEELNKIIDRQNELLIKG